MKFNPSVAPDSVEAYITSPDTDDSSYDSITNIKFDDSIELLNDLNTVVILFRKKAASQKQTRSIHKHSRKHTRRVI